MLYGLRSTMVNLIENKEDFLKSRSAGALGRGEP